MKPEEQEQRIEELYLLQRVTQKINSILDLDTLLEEIVSDVVQTFGYSRSGVLLKDNETNELEIVAVRGWTVNYHIKGDRFKIGEYGIVGHVASTGETYYSPDVLKDPYYQVSEESTRSEVDIPLKNNRELIGVFNIQHQDPDAFKPERISLLESLAVHIAIAIENAQLFLKERLEKERMQRELNEARSIQSKLFPENLPEIPGLKVSGICIPCLEVGGDWYDYIHFPDGKLGIVLADVSGKGMGAALLMSSTRSLLRLIANEKNSPKDVLRNLNEILLKDLPTARFITMIYAVVNSKDESLLFANAGHLKPVLTSDSVTKYLDTPDGLPLGITDSLYSETEIKFRKGDRIIFYSDGVTEAMDTASEEYGDKRLIEHLSNGNANVETLLEDVKKFTHGIPSSDDVTVVMVEGR